MSKRERRRGGRSKRARVRGKEGDFFSSCKPFQLCSGLRTETGSERKREQSLGAHTSQREKERKKGKREKRNWDCVALCFILSTQSEAGERIRQRNQRKGRECVLGLSAGKRGGRRCLQSKAWTVAGRAVWVFALWIQSHDSLLCPARLPACLLAWLVQDPAFSPPLFCLPPDAPFHFSLTLSKILPAFDLLYHLSPGAVDDLRIKEKNSNTDRHFFMKKQTAFPFVLELALCSNRG